MRKASDGERLYYQRLSGFLRQFKGLANNYNQVTRAILVAHGEPRAHYLLSELQKLTAEMAGVMKEVVGMTRKAKQKWEKKDL